MPSISTVKYIGTVTVEARMTDPTYTYVTNGTTRTIVATSQDGSWSVNINPGSTDSMRGVDVIFIRVPNGSSVGVPALNKFLNVPHVYMMFGK